MVSEALLTEAKKYIPEPDYILNMFTMIFEWASQQTLKLSGFTLEEMTSMRNTDLVDENSKEEAHKSVVNRLMHNEGVDTTYSRTKDGKKVQLTVQYKIFTYEGETYLVGKALEVKRVNDDGSLTSLEETP